MGSRRASRGEEWVETQRIALDLPRLTLNDLAKACGVSRSAMDRYRTGSLKMSGRVREELAEYLTKHAESLKRLAKEL